MLQIAFKHFPKFSYLRRDVSDAGVQRIQEMSELFEFIPRTEVGR
jgi:hypothetical protein